MVITPEREVSTAVTIVVLDARDTLTVLTTGSKPAAFPIQSHLAPHKTSYRALRRLVSPLLSKASDKDTARPHGAYFVFLESPKTNQPYGYI